jgi:hypothetical protein
VLDDGRLTDSKGHVVDFANTIVLATTNLGAQYLLREAETQASNERKRVRAADSTGKADALYGGATTSVSESDVDMSGGAGLRTSNKSGVSPDTEARVMGVRAPVAGVCFVCGGGGGGGREGSKLALSASPILSHWNLPLVSSATFSLPTYIAGDSGSFPPRIPQPPR